jgi:hypothetical protein
MTKIEILYFSTNQCIIAESPHFQSLIRSNRSRGRHPFGALPVLFTAILRLFDRSWAAYLRLLLLLERRYWGHRPLLSRRWSFASAVWISLFPGYPTVCAGFTGKSFHHHRDHPKLPSNDALRDCVRAPCAAVPCDPFRSQPTHWPNALHEGSILAHGSAIEPTCLVADLVWLGSFPESYNLIDGAQYPDQILQFAPVATGQDRVGLSGRFGLTVSRSIPPIPDPK